MSFFNFSNNLASDGGGGGEELEYESDMIQECLYRGPIGERK